MSVVESSQEEIVFEWENIELAGTLHVPSGQPPFPAVLMLQGSGEADRDSGDFFPQIRDAFLARGIAAYSFDKPGIGGSSGDWRGYALNGRAEQASAALEHMRAHEAIDAERVGIWGHSQGGWLVQMLAARLPDLPFAVANSGAAITVEQQDLAGCEHTMRAAGKSEEDIARALAFLNALHAAALHGDDYTSVDRKLLVPARGQPWYGYMEFDDAVAWSMMCQFIGEQYEPAGALARVRCPFLAIYGALDPLVPAWESAQITSQSLHEAGNADATIVVFPSGNHRIIAADTGAFVTGYLDLLGDWTEQRVGQAGRMRRDT